MTSVVAGSGKVGVGAGASKQTTEGALGNADRQAERSPPCPPCSRWNMGKQPSSKVSKGKNKAGTRLGVFILHMLKWAYSDHTWAKKRLKISKTQNLKLVSSAPNTCFQEAAGCYPTVSTIPKGRRCALLRATTHLGKPQPPLGSPTPPLPAALLPTSLHSSLTFTTSKLTDGCHQICSCHVCHLPVPSTQLAARVPVCRPSSAARGPPSAATAGLFPTVMPYLSQPVAALSHVVFALGQQPGAPMPVFSLSVAGADLH